MCSLDLETANAGILLEACYPDPIMIRLVKKYLTVLRAGLVVSWIRLLLRVKSLPLVLDRLNPRSMTEKPDEAMMEIWFTMWIAGLNCSPITKKGIASHGRCLSIGSPGDWDIQCAFIVV